MSVPPQGHNSDGFLWRSTNMFHTNLYSGDLQNGPLVIAFSSNIGSATVTAIRS
jgi:hypothetical protein